MVIDAAKPSTPVAWAALGMLSGAVTLLLAVAAGGYGYHRDELYFIEAGAHPALGYVDQPPLTPLLAKAMDLIFAGSLLGLRLPSAVMAGVIVFVTGLIAREFGAARGPQLLAAAAMSVASVLMITGHLLSTTTTDLFFWALITWGVVRALRDGGRVWLLLGAVCGIALENKMLPAALLAALLVGVLAVGPRIALRSRWPWLGALMAFVLWSPNLVWEIDHGFPQLTLAGAIAGGSSVSSQPWYLFVPFQLLLVSPLLVRVWAWGWWRLARDPQLLPWRGFAVAYLLLLVAFTAAGGKPYYLAGFFPVLLAAGAAPVAAWVGAGIARRWALGTALALSLAISATLGLPLIPVDRLADTPVPAINPDAAETVGWPRFVATIVAVRSTLPDASVAVLTQNYGEAGAIDHFAPLIGPAHSGQNSYWYWGPPPAAATTVIVVGYSEQVTRSLFTEVTPAGRVDDGVGLGNTEQNRPIWVARYPVAPWAELWPTLRRLS